MSSPLQIGPLTLRLDTGIAHWDGGQAKLSRKECALLQALWTDGTHVVSREALIQRVWQGAAGNRNRLVVALSRLKKKVANAPINIQARGTGYVLLHDSQEAVTQGLRLSDRTLNLDAGTLQTPETVHTLTPKERALFTILVDHPNLFVSRTDLIHTLWGHGLDKSSALSSLLKRCVQKLEVDPAHPIHLKTKSGAGIGLFWEVLTDVPEESLDVVASSPFVGRKDTLEQLVHTLGEGQRCVTLLGPGGGGKTRIVQRLIETDALHSLYGKAVTFCDVSACTSGPDVMTKMAESLGLRLNPNETWQAQSVTLGQSLALRERSLVIVDNFEQLVDFAEDTLGVWMRLAPKIQFIVTSRRRLKLEAAQVVALEPMTPQDSVALFLNQVGRLCPELRFRATERKRIQSIVARLEGNPLAVLMAAGQLQEQDYESWAEGFESDTALRVDLDRVLSRSWDILSESEQNVLVQSTVFRGGFTLEAAEAILDAEDDWVDDVLQQLLDHSLLFVRLETDGHYRYGLYETVRDFCGRRTKAEAQKSAASHRLLHYYGGNAEAWHNGLLSPHEPTTERIRAKLNPEKENLWTAFELGAQEPTDATGWVALVLEVLGLAGHEAERILEVLLVLEAQPLGGLRGPLAQTIWVLTKTSSAEAYQSVRDRLINDETIPMMYRIRFQAWQWMDNAIAQHDFTLHEAEFVEQLKIWTAPSGERSALLEGLARLRGYQGQSKDSIALYKEAVAAGQGHISAELTRIYTGNIGHRLIDRGCVDEGAELLRGHLAHMRGQTRGRLNLLPTVWNLGNVALARGEFSEAFELFEEGRTHCRQTGGGIWLSLMGSLTAACAWLLDNQEAARATLASYATDATPKNGFESINTQIQGSVWLLLGEREKAEPMWAAAAPFRAEAWAQVWRSMNNLMAPTVDQATWEQAKAMCTAPTIQIPRIPIEEDVNSNYSFSGLWVLVVLLEELVKQKKPTRP